uniref:Late embryogenesis abundant protein LEA-2 subgroup domain-containing protein n=1 Tax=Aegilops tauschii TaxID=37682 RepID=M8CBP3_AEGTA
MDMLVMVFVLCIVGLLFWVLALGLVGLEASRLPEFSVVMDGFSDLEDHVARTFNLTVVINNFGGKSEACVGGEAVVLYGGVPLAGCGVQDLCVPPKCSTKFHIVAASGGVGLPGELAERMADEKHAGGAVQVEVRVVSPKHRVLRTSGQFYLRHQPSNSEIETTLQMQADNARDFMTITKDGVRRTADPPGFLF